MGWALLQWGDNGRGIELCPSPGMRILLVDQWVETGGTMRAAIQLVERQGGVVAGRMGTRGWGEQP